MVTSELCRVQRESSRLEFVDPPWIQSSLLFFFLRHLLQRIARIGVIKFLFSFNHEFSNFGGYRGVSEVDLAKEKRSIG